MDTAYYVLDPQTFKLYPKVILHPPEAQKLHTAQVAHLVSGSHVPSHPIRAKPSQQCQTPHPPASSFVAYLSVCPRDQAIQLPHILQRLLSYIHLSSLTLFLDRMPRPTLFVRNLPHMSCPHRTLAHSPNGIPQLKKRR